MKKTLLDLQNEIVVGEENAKKAKELYELLSSYNAYSILLLKARSEYERKKLNFNQCYLDSNCYKDQGEDLFSIFNSDECLKVKQLLTLGDKDMLFLIDNDTLLRINSFDIINSYARGLSRIHYDLLEISECRARIYNQSVYSGDPYYCDYHSEEKEAFGLLDNGNLVTPSYVLDSQFKFYDNMDIREILKIQSLDEIYGKITEAKNKKVKNLILTK